MVARKSITFLHYSCPPVVGGVEEVLYQQAAACSRHGHSVKVLAGAGGRFTDQFEVIINPLLGSRNPEVVSAQKNLDDRRELDSLTKTLAGVLHKELCGSDIVIAHNVLTMSYNLPLTLALRKAAEAGLANIIAWCHDSPFFYKNPPNRLFADPWEVLRAPGPGIQYVTITNARKAQFEELMSGVHFQVIPNGVDPYGFLHLDPKIRQLVQERGLFESDLLLFQPTRLHPRKNIEFSISVVRAFKTRGTDARLLLTGSYDPHEESTFQYFVKLKAMAEELDVVEEVVFLPELLIPRDEKLSTDRRILRDLYLISDLLFMPSLSEGFGIPLLEAGVARLPIVCSRIPPFEEVGGGDVCFFSLDETPEEVALKTEEFIGGLPLHRMFRRTIEGYLWDNIYRLQILPLIEKTTV